MATALLQPFNDSGVSAELTLYESEDGSTLTVVGIATGMRILGQYLSLACDLDSDTDRLGGDLTSRSVAQGNTVLGLWKGVLGTRVGAKRTLQIVRSTSDPSGVHLYELSTVSIHRSSTYLWRDSTYELRTQLSVPVACGEILRVP
ncbi:MAG: hypothetical protein ACRDTG_32270 [Pseudonocardiaceae bacterium]